MVSQRFSRRRFLAAAASVTGASLLLACSGQPAVAPTAATQTSGQTTAPSPTAAAAAKMPEIKPAKITFMINGGEAEQKAWNARRDVLQKKYPQIDVVTEVVPQGYGEKLTASIASDTAPDTFRVGTLSDWVPKKLIVSLEKYLKSDAEFKVDDMLPGTIDRGKYKGEFYAMPGGLGPQVTFYNVKHFKDAGLPTPREEFEKKNWNFETFQKAAIALTQRDATGKATRFGYTHYQPYWSWAIQANGPTIFNQDYTECYYDKPEHYEALQFAADIVLKHKAAPNATEAQAFGTWQGFLKGNYSMFISGPWQQGRIGPTIADPWDIAPPPMQKNGKTMMNAGPGGEVIYVKCKDPDAAWKWLLVSDGSAEGQAIWAGLGFDLPNLKTVLDEYVAGKYFTDPKIKPDNVKLWKNIIPDTVKNPDTYLPAKANDEFNNAFGRVVSGQASAKDAMTEAVQRANPILKAAAQ